MEPSFQWPLVAVRLVERSTIIAWPEVSPLKKFGKVKNCMEAPANRTTGLPLRTLLTKVGRFAAVVWVGYDDNKPLGSAEQGASTALPAWVQLMKAAHEGKPRAEFPKPPGIVAVAIDPKSGKLAGPNDEGTIDEVFLEGTEPSETSDADGGAAEAGPDP